MRVCVVSQEYPGVSDYYGGIGTQYRAFAPAWARSGAEVHVVCFAPMDGSRPPDELEGVHIHAIPRGLAWPWHAELWDRRMQHVLAGIGPCDAVLSPEFRGELGRYVDRPVQGPAVTHLLTSSEQLLALRPGLSWLERHGPRTHLILHLERRQAERSAAILAAGRAVLDWARDLWPGIGQVPSHVIPLAIRVAGVREMASAAAPPEGFPSSRGPVVTLASRLDGHKGAQHLVDAMQAVWRRHPDAQLVFVGRDSRFEGGRMSEHLVARAGDRAANVHVFTDLPAERYFAAVAASDVIAIPSLWESFCLAAVEAMALGKPVIGTRDNGFSEYLQDGENGLLVGRGSVGELAGAVERLLDDGALRERLGAAAVSTAEGLDVDAVAPRYLEAFAAL